MHAREPEVVPTAQYGSALARAEAEPREARPWPS
jgi:hypothetical protein